MANKEGQYTIDDLRLNEIRVQIKEGAGDVLFGNTAIVSSDDAAKLIGEKLLRYADREHLVVVCMDNKLFPVGYSICSVGTINGTSAHPREIMKSAILANAGSIMLMHNHPSGSTVPSAEDIALTHRMSEACDLMGIPLLDHIIVGGGDHPQPYYSFRIEDNLRGNDHSSYAREETTEYSASAVTVDYYVHECSEYPSLGEQHHGLTLDQAVAVYERIPSSHLNGIKSIGIEIHDPIDKWYDGYALDLYRGKVIEDALEYSDYLRSQLAVQQAFKAIQDRFAPKEERSAETATIVPSASSPSDDTRAVFETDFGWVRLERYDRGEIHYMTYGRDYWGQEARFVKGEGSLLQVARQVTQELRGYNGPLQPVDLDAFKAMLRKAHPERYIEPKEQDHIRRLTRHHSHR